MTGPVRHTITFGTEFGLQAGFAQRNTGYFPSGGGLANTTTVNPFSPTYFGPVFFIHSNIPGGQVDASSRSDLYVSSVYVQDQIDLTRFLQLIAGVRYDRYDFTALDQNTNTTRSRVDEKLSPRLGLVFKPLDNLSFYGAYSTSFLPASGDQFSALTDATVILDPQKFENYELGVKYNINPKLLWAAAIYQLNRSGVPVPDRFEPASRCRTASTRSAARFLADRLRHARLAIRIRLRLHRRADRERPLRHDCEGQPRAARAVPSVLMVEQVPVHAGVVGGGRHHLFLRSFASSDNSVKLPAW